MLIHSVTPPQALTEQPQIPALSMRHIPGGCIEGVETPAGFKATRLYSTNPAHYLKKGYSPGSILQGKGH
jgi:hypothetical protein